MTPFVSALLIKLTLILSLGLVVAATLRSLSPSFRHLVLYAALVSSAALPFVMGLSPEWNVPLLPPSMSALNFASNQKQGASPGFQNINPSANTRASETGTSAGPSNAALTAKVVDGLAAQSPSALRSVFSTIGLLPLIWVRYNPGENVPIVKPSGLAIL